MIDVRLSRSNVIRLLAHLERGEEAPLIKPSAGVCIFVEPDATHYKNRPAGQASPATQAVIDEIEACLALRRKLKGTPLCE